MGSVGRDCEGMRRDSKRSDVFWSPWRYGGVFRSRSGIFSCHHAMSVFESKRRGQ